MKTLLVAAVLLASSLPAFASPAVEYSCVGKDAKSGQAVVYGVEFSDSDIRTGYTNQSVTVTQVGYEVATPAPTFQMYGATAKNNCQNDGQGAVYTSGKFKMEPTKKGDIAPYTVSFQTNCGEGKTFNVTGYCFFQN